MERGEPLPARLRGRPVTGILAGGSLVPVVPWRGIADLASGLVGYLDLLAIVFVVVQPILGSSTVGLAFAWLLIGWLTYQYAHLLYPAEFEAVVDFTGFRALTALGTLYFGLMCWGTVLPHVVPVQVLAWSQSSESATLRLTLLVLLSGIIGGTLLFGLYLTRWHPKKLYDEESDLTALFQSVFGDADEPISDTLPARWQSIYRWERTISSAMLPPIICVLVGLAAVMLNVFYPIPEAAFVIGLLALRIWPDTEPNTEPVPNHEMDLRLLDVISGATQNLKGSLMIVFGGLGVVLSGLTFFVFVDSFFILLNAIEFTWTKPVRVTALSLLAVVWFLLATLLLGMYSLVHWVRQLERIEPYARRWNGTDDERRAEDIDKNSLVTRPPGFLLPAHLPLLGLILSAAIAAATESSLVGRGVMVSWMFIAVIVMGWGLVWTWRHRDEPQPLTHESRDLLVTILLQQGVIGMIGIIDVESLQINTEIVLTVVLGLLAITVVYYVPDIYHWQSRQEGLRQLLIAGPTVVAIILAIALGRITVEGSTLLLESVLIGLGTVIIVSTLIEVYLEHITE